MTKLNSGVPKSYARFSWKDIAHLGLNVEEGPVLLNIAPLSPSDWLLESLDNPFNIKSATESAKAIFSIGPIIREIAKQNRTKIGVFPGYAFNVDETKGLVGACDFLFTRNAKDMLINAPVFLLTEAKNESLEVGGPQCCAEMYAAQLFNLRAGKPIQTIFGAVTFGREWQFYRLDGTTVTRDPNIYQLRDLPLILGYLQAIVDAV